MRLDHGRRRFFATPRSSQDAGEVCQDAEEQQSESEKDAANRKGDPGKQAT
jgi:hypothetical protein